MLCGILIKTDYKQLNRFVMKTKLLIIAGLIGVCCLISCKKEGMDNHGNSNVDGDKTEDTLPELEEVDDVCTKMDDINFTKYCYDKFDVNKDGKVSMKEANAVKVIFCSSSVVSCAGIEYFSNLELLSIGGIDYGIFSEEPAIKTLDLCYNKCLNYLYIHNAKCIQRLDLRPNTELKSAITIQKCIELVSVYLPKSIEKIPTLAFDGCDKLSVVDMSQCVNLKEIEGAFYGYTFPSNIDVFLIGATVPPKTSDRSFEYNSIKTLKVPAESVEAYENSVWEDYAVKIIPLEN